MLFRSEIIKKTKCSYLKKLLEKIIIIDINLKTQNKFNPKKIKFISPHDFIHKCLINISIFCWKNVYLFSTKNLKPSEKQYHLNLIEDNIKKIIKNTIKSIFPYETILNTNDEKKNKDKEREKKILIEKKKKKEIEKEKEIGRAHV